MGSPRMVEYQGELMSMSELARRTGLEYATLRNRICRRGVTGDEAARIVLEEKRVYEVGGELLTVAQMAKRCGVSAYTIRNRMKRGDTPEHAMRPVDKKNSSEQDSVERLTWPEKAFAMLYGSEAKKEMGFRQLSKNDWGWTSDYFTYMASRLGSRHVLLRAWWRESETPAMLRLYLLEEREGKDDVLTEVLEQGHKRAVLRRWGVS